MTENEKRDKAEAERDKARDKADEKFVRWQGIRITQLSYSINLILTFSVAAIGFGTSLLLNDDFQPTACMACLYYVSLAFFLVSGGFGIWATINRLRDFRATEGITNLKRKHVHDNDVELIVLRVLTKKLGKATWGLFWWQIGTFSFGVILFCSFVISTRFFQ